MSYRFCSYVKLTYRLYICVCNVNRITIILKYFFRHSDKKSRSGRSKDFYKGLPTCRLFIVVTVVGLFRRLGRETPVKNRNHPSSCITVTLDKFSLQGLLTWSSSVSEFFTCICVTQLSSAITEKGDMLGCGSRVISVSSGSLFSSTKKNFWWTTVSQTVVNPVAHEISILLSNNL